MRTTIGAISLAALVLVAGCDKDKPAVAPAPDATAAPAPDAATASRGTIPLDDGIGAVGAVGQGAGLAVGALGGRGIRTTSSSVTMGTVTVKGKLDTAIVRRSLRMKQAHVQYCYEKALQTRPDLHGKVTVELTIAPTGAVTTAPVKGMTDEVNGCITQALASMQLPKPPDGKPVTATTTYTFKAPEP